MFSRIYWKRLVLANNFAIKHEFSPRNSLEHENSGEDIHWCTKKILSFLKWHSDIFVLHTKNLIMLSKKLIRVFIAETKCIRVFSGFSPAVDYRFVSTLNTTLDAKDIPYQNRILPCCILPRAYIDLCDVFNRSMIKLFADQTNSLRHWNLITVWIKALCGPRLSMRSFPLILFRIITKTCSLFPNYSTH